MLEISLFSEKYAGLLSHNQFNRIEDFILGLADTVEFSDAEIAELDQKLKVKHDFNDKLEKTAFLNNQGIAFEKSGDVESAINAYEESIRLGYPATHSFIRLMFLYRRCKKYQDELRVIERGIEVMRHSYPDESLKYAQRFLKVVRLV